MTTLHKLLLEFKQLTGTGPKGERHAEEYITPHEIAPRGDHRSSDSPLSLISSFKHPKTGKPIPAGTRLVPIRGTRQTGNKGALSSKFHAVDENGNSTKIDVPHSRVQTETSISGKHNDEHGVIRAWNHFSSTHGGKVPALEHMHDEIERARNDPEHPLHISKADKKEFVHGVNGLGDSGSSAARERAAASHNRNLRDAAHSIRAMASHPDFKNHWKNGDTLDTAGRTRPELSDLYKESGVKGAGATSKGDAITVRVKSKTGKHKGIKAISLKQDGGSQLMSSSPAEFRAIYTHALRQIHGHDGEKPMSPEHQKHQKRVEDIRKHLESGDHVSAQKKLAKLHKDLDDRGLNREVHKEAITGNGKFNGDEGKATHVVTIGKNAAVSSVGKFLDEYEPHFSQPNARAGKRGPGTNSTAVRLETPKKPKIAAVTSDVRQKVAQKVAQKKAVAKKK